MDDPKSAPQNNANGYGLVLFPLPFHGHMTPMFHLATALHTKGFSITIVHTKFGSPNAARYPHFSFRCIQDGMGDDGFSDKDLMGVFSLLDRTCLNPFRDCLSQILSEACPVACLISDPMWMFVDDVAKSFGLRHLVLRTGSVLATSVYNSLRSLRDKGYYSAKDTSPETPLVEFPPLKVKDLPVLYGDTKQAHLDHFSNYAATIKKSSGIISNSFEELESEALTRVRTELQIPIFPIGPIHKYSLTNACSVLEDDETSISWLDKQAPGSVLFVCYGSTASISEADFLELAWALARSEQPFLWAVRPGLIRNSEWVEPLPEGFLEEVAGRGHIVRWAPQQRVLAHPAVGGFLSHCGWNSVVESVSEGVPLICLPCFADQMMNARYACEGWGAGILVESGPRRDGIESAIRGLMKGRDGEEIRQRMGDLKDKADVAFEEGGSSFQALEKLTRFILLVNELRNDHPKFGMDDLDELLYERK